MRLKAFWIFQIVDASTKSVQQAMQSALQKMNTTSGHLVGTLTDELGNESYPIATFTYLIVRMTTTEDCNTAKELCRYIEWFLTEVIIMWILLLMSYTIVAHCNQTFSNG